MTDEQNERAARVAKVIAKAMGDNFADAFKNKQRWTAKHGMSGGRFRDINEPFQSDYLAAAEAATAVIAREFEALEAENAALKAIQADEGEMLTIAWMDGAHRARQNHRERITALEAEVKRLRELVEAGRLAIGDHFAPNDCYATGPLTGNSYRDLVVCPACSFLTDYDAMKARAALGAEP